MSNSPSVRSHQQAIAIVENWWQNKDDGNAKEKLSELLAKELDAAWTEGAQAGEDVQRLKNILAQK